MGPGYWVWLIPLAGDRTSLGIVADADQHPFSELCSFEGALDWLDRHEPQCASVARGLRDRRMDFSALRGYAHDTKRMFSGERWCLVGDAGVFVDPLYSPGSDFIAMANDYVVDLIARDRAGETVAAAADRYDRAYRALARTYLVNYHRQYGLMGNARVMTTKIVWDFVMYWGGGALLYFGDRLRDEAFMRRVQPIMHRFASMNLRMQALFRDWADASKGAHPAPGTFVDYAEMDFMARLNEDLTRMYDDEALYRQLAANLRLAEELRIEINAEAARWVSGLDDASGEGAGCQHLSEMFDALRPATGA